MRENLLSAFTVERLLIDEASQIYLGDYLAPINSLPALRFMRMLSSS